MMHARNPLVRCQFAWAVMLSCVLLGMATHGYAASGDPDPRAILQEAKAATGGSAWDALRTQHSRVRLVSGGQEGTAERWASLLTGRSRTGYSIGGRSGVIAYDGFGLWTQDAVGKPRVETDPDVNRLAVNTAYRDRLAFWYPERQAGTLEYARREHEGNVDFDVVRITPEGGIAYEVWVSAVTHRIERLREPDPMGMRTDLYSDFREVQGVRVPFAVQTTRPDPKLDERYNVNLLEYNVSLDHVSFEPPGR